MRISDWSSDVCSSDLADKKFLEQLLAGAKANFMNFDVPIGILVVPDRQPRKLDHVSGEVPNANGVTHIQQENLAPFRRGARLDHKLCGLRNEHEIASHVPMGNSDGSAFGDRPAKERHHRSA